MKHKSILVLYALFHFSQISAYGANFSVMTFNILGLDSPYPWATRKDDLVSLIKSKSPDLLGTQEIRYDHIADHLQSYLTEYESFPPDRTIIAKNWQNFVFYKKSRFSRIDAGYFLVGRHDRSCTWVLLKDISTGSQFYIFNTHWVPDGAGYSDSHGSRLIAAQQIVDKIESINSTIPIIVMGDLNTAPYSSEFILLRNSASSCFSLNDIFTSYGNGRIDHILQRNFTVGITEKSSSPPTFNGNPVSDHPYFMAKLTIGPTAARCYSRGESIKRTRAALHMMQSIAD